MADRPGISDELLDQLLSDPDAVAAVDALARQEGITTPVAGMPRDQQSALVAQMLQRAQAAELTSGDIDPDEVPDDLIEQIFADPRGDAILREIMADNGLEGEPAELPEETKRIIVKLLIDQGVISFEPAQGG